MKIEVKADSDELFEILKATNKEKPARADVQRLETYLVKHPKDVVKLGDLANQAMTAVIDHAFGQPSVSLPVAHYMARMRIDMRWDNSGIIERSLIDHVILCWLRLYTTELRYERNMEEGLTLAQGEYWEKKLSANQRRYLRAVETLARVRRLMKDPPNPAFNLLLKQQVLNISK